MVWAEGWVTGLARGWRMEERDGLGGEMGDRLGQRLAGSGRVAAAHNGARRLPREEVEGEATGGGSWGTAAAHSGARLLPDGLGEL